MRPKSRPKSKSHLSASATVEQSQYPPPPPTRMVLMLATIYCMIQAWALAAPVLALALPFLPVIVACQVVGFYLVWSSFDGSRSPGQGSRRSVADKIVRVDRADRRRRLSIFDRVQEVGHYPFVSRSTVDVEAASQCESVRRVKTVESLSLSLSLSLTHARTHAHAHTPSHNY